MRRVKSLLCLVFAVLCCVCLVACGGGEEPDNRPTFVVGMECDYPPFNWTEMTKTDTNYPIDGTSLYAEGYDVQVAKMIADELDMKLVIKAIEWDGLISALESGKIDAIIAGMSDTPDRRLNVDFTVSYYKSTHVLVMEKDSPYVNGKTLNDFAGAKVVGQIETLYDSLIDQLAGVEHQTPLADVPTIITSITSKRADITILEEPVAMGVVLTNPNLTYVTLTDGFEVDESAISVAIAIKKGETELNEKISAVLNAFTEQERTDLMNEAIERNQ